mmetsp:Transcript_1520/g.4465  ORF Transcript_1520/g.4465 Transcript_1520/m.4465 type:complete len:229 (-) Transcript_1520:1109-1795(-)
MVGAAQGGGLHDGLAEAPGPLLRGLADGPGARVRHDGCRSGLLLGPRDVPGDAVQLRRGEDLALDAQIRHCARVATIEHASQPHALGQLVEHIIMYLRVEDDVLAEKSVRYVQRANDVAQAARLHARAVGAVGHLRAVAAVREIKDVAPDGALHQPFQALDDAGLVRPVLLRLVLGQGHEIAGRETELPREDLLVGRHVVDATAKLVGRADVIDPNQQRLFRPGHRTV